ncbi:o-succinylbenzoate synthase [Maribacter sp. HTCC2170]|uniref:o-succinylbenzoate synthase n=1 Tax=Maribacter sp. (strain HTCC2170 / KCCM 42371) TaxID=313603 RepID=UPI00006B2273|nr:o-succinylbenzoate synthase [Maribacter sp. HTCC2170]EAR00310.1 chloromuconate cycloisomerase [Maribacter sp. HTCC2170]
MNARVKKYILDFKRPSGTSRGILTNKETWFLILEDNGNYGIGECGMFKGLSHDDLPDYENMLKWTCRHIDKGVEYLLDKLINFPSIQFGLEQAFISLNSNNPFELFPSDFTENEAQIPINGLVWMGDEGFMLEQIQKKLEEGFTCIKMKIGAIDFKTEISLLETIRKNYSHDQIEIRVDANGAFKPSEALDKLKVLANYDLHSIEQPIKQGNFIEMKRLCKRSPLPIALDEELIGITTVTKKEELLHTIKPKYIILKPTLVGGFKGSSEWIRLAQKYDIGWWVTSALESNIGLNAIAQWTYSLKNPMPQGLGTGGLFTNNFDCPLKVKKGYIYYDNNESWKADLIKDLCI